MEAVQEVVNKDIEVEKRQEDTFEEREFYIIKVSVGKEEKLILDLQKVLKKNNEEDVYSVFSPKNIKGYIFAETINQQKLLDALRGLPNYKGVIRNPIKFEEVEKYFSTSKEIIEVAERDIVQVISGAFRGERAKVTRLIAGKDEIVIEPLDTPVPIPITLNISDVRVIKDEMKNEEGEEKEE